MLMIKRIQPAKYEKEKKTNIIQDYWMLDLLDNNVEWGELAALKHDNESNGNG